MRRFAALYETLDATTSTRRKVAAMEAYFAEAPPQDAAWAVWFLSGRRLKRLVGGAKLRRWLTAATGLPDWLVEESYAAVGDLAETVALLAAGGEAGEAAGPGLAEWVEERLLGLAGQDEAVQQAAVTGWWRALPPESAFLLTKLLTGALRVGVSQPLVARALAVHAGLDRAVILQRLTGPWQPSAEAWRRLVAADTADEDRSRPYPFFLASPLDHAADAAAVANRLGERADWLVEWKWDGIRAQLVRRGAPELWSRGEELVTGRFPEVASAAAALPPGTVLDGELIAWNDAGVMPFAALQRRLGRKRLPAALLAEVPVVFLAYDLLEKEGMDRRGEPLDARRAGLRRCLDGAPAALRLSPPVHAPDWPSLERLRGESRARGVEGFMLKRRDSAYGTGRQRGAWWKWKVAPWTVDAVLVYAQPGHGRRASLYTDYTFAVWRDAELVPVAKAYSGLEDVEITELDRWIRRHTVERFGPVRSVEAVQVFELAFEGIASSSRHKSGLALRFPRIARWRRDLGPRDADTLASLAAVLESAGA